MNLYESVRNNLKESESPEKLKAELIDYLNKTYGPNWELIDGVNDFEGEELLDKLANEYLDFDYAHTYYADGTYCSFIDFINSSIEDPHGLLKVKVNDTVNEGEAPQTYERGNAPFESKRVPEDRIREEGYLYFSTHGTGPGTSPRDVRVREMDWDLPGGWVAIKTDRPLTSEELDWYDIQPETKNNYYRQRFHLEEAEDFKEKIPNDLKVETCEAEQTGGWVWVAYGKMTDGRYYCLFAEGVSFFDDDIHKYEYEEDHWDETQGDFSDWEDAHRIKTDPGKYYTYWYTDPEYLIMLKQCIALDPNAEYIADEDELTQIGIDKLYEESEDEYVNPDYYVDVRDLTLTNGNYHNNADMIYGRIIIKGKTKNAKDVGAYDIMYVPENNHLSVFRPGFNVQELSDIIYDFYEPNDWILFGGNRIQAKAIQEDFDNTFASDMVNINSRTKEAIIGAIDDAYYNEKPIPLNTRKYQ